MMSAALLLTLNLAVISCGSGDDGNKDPVIQEQTTAPNEGETEETNLRRETSFTKHCRPVEEIEGGNFEYFWAVPHPGEFSRVSLNTSQNKVMLEVQASEEDHVSKYRVVSPEEGQIGINGTLAFNPYQFYFPVLPTGTIRGSTKEYAIGVLQREHAEVGTFLCPLSVEKELEVSQE